MCGTTTVGQKMRERAIVVLAGPQQIQVTMGTDNPGGKDVPGVLRLDVNREEIELRCEVARKVSSRMTATGDVIAASGDTTGGFDLHSP